MRRLLLWLITIYRVNLSPYKGFRCAYHIRTGRRSCSTFGFAVIDRRGAPVGLLLLRRRFRKCALTRPTSPYCAPESRRTRQDIAICQSETVISGTAAMRRTYSTALPVTTADAPNARGEDCVGRASCHAGEIDWAKDIDQPQSCPHDETHQRLPTVGETAVKCAGRARSSVG
jgi:putative component of membrane protein insertase Oxa1/YidC/SpoIIIJ protein YidD